MAKLLCHGINVMIAFCYQSLYIIYLASETRMRCIFAPRWVIQPKNEQYILVVFSVTRRSRSDVGHWLTDWLDVSIDLTNVTLVTDDTWRRLDKYDSSKWELSSVYWWQLSLDESCLLMKDVFWWKLSNFFTDEKHALWGYQNLIKYDTERGCWDKVRKSA